MFNLTLFSGNRIDASALEPGEPLFCVVVFGGLVIDCTACEDSALQDITVVSVMGGVNLKVRPDQPVRLDGFSFLGGRNVEPRRLPGLEMTPADDLPLELSAYAFLGGVNVERKL